MQIPNKIILIISIVFLYSSATNAAVDEKLAYLEYTGDFWQVFILDLHSKKSKQISRKNYDVSVVSWLGDGNRLFICGLQGEASIMNIVTGETVDIALPFKTVNDAVISPDGTKILFSTIAEGSMDNKLWVYDISNKKTEALFSKLPGRQYDPKWGENEDEVYFISGVSNESYGVRKGSLKNNKSNSVIKDSYYNLDVDISKHGKVVYSSNHSGDYDIWARQNKKVWKVLEREGTESHPVWSPDENTIYFEAFKNGISNIWSVDSGAKDKSKSAIKQITFSKNGARYPVVYNGGKL